MRLVVRWSMGLVALAAAALSYQSLMALAELAGYGRLSVLYPLVVDAGAAASCAAWLHTRGRQPLVMTWALLAVSVVLNGTTHYLTSTGTPPSWLLVVAVAAVPPTVLGLCVHLAVGMGSTLVTLVTRVPESAPSVKTFAHGTSVKTFTDVGSETCPDEVYGKPATNDAPLLPPVSNGKPVKTFTPFESAICPDEVDEKYPQVTGGFPLKESFPEGYVDPVENFPQDSRYVAELISQGAGRRKLAAELNISEYEARKLIAASRNGDGHVQA